MSAIDHACAAVRILNDRLRQDLHGTDAFEAASAEARIALALAAIDLAAAAQADAKLTSPLQQAWPDGVTARILTRVGMRSRDLADATVDIHDDPDNGTNGVSRAVCRPCGWTRAHGLTYRDKLLQLASEHAGECTALPKPDAA